MSRHDQPSLDSVVGSIREDEPTRAEIDAAADRVRASLGFDAPQASASPIHIESCAGFQALIPDYLAGRLPRATALLFEDHSRECIPCRRALVDARRPAAVTTTAAPARQRTAWLAAASIAAASVLAGYTAWQVLPGLSGGPDLKVVRIEGDLFRVAGDEMVPLQAGMTIPASESVRTAKDSGALLELPDGSRIEMRDRTELGMSARRGGSTIELAGGSVIVEAAPQGANRLRVATDDCTVSVKGTIFAVNNGTKGSRVSVVEGSVEMDAGGSERLLRSGDQGTTSAAVDAIAVADEVSWSRDSARYAKLLNELASLRKDLDARVPNPKLRYSSKLLGMVPQETVIYAAIPNLTNSILEARQVFMEHVAESDALQEWWNAHMSSPEQQADVDRAFAHIKEVGALLGEEIVVSFAMGNNGKVRGPMVTAEVSDLWALRRAFAKHGENVDVETDVRVRGKIVTIEPKRAFDDPVQLSGFDFQGNPFRDRLAASYKDGVSWLFGANLAALMKGAAYEASTRGENGERLTSTWEKMGVLDARYLIAERDESETSATMRAEVTFDGQRRGVAAWLSDPAPMGALAFVSPDASFAAAGVIKRPEALIEEAIGWIAADSGQNPLQHLDEFRAESGVDPVHDIAGALGGDMAIALDGPVLPVPAWKLVIEVYDAPRLQSSFEKLSRWVNGKLEAEGKTGRLLFGSEEAGNRTDWILRFTGTENDEANMLRYTIVDGYFVAAPSKGLLDRAIEQRGNGYSLTRSATFTQLLPRDGDVNVSALVWQNLGPMLGPIAGRLSGLLADAELQELNSFAQGAKPSLVTLSAGNDRIVLNSHGDPGFGSMLGSVVSMNQLGMFSRMLHETAEKHHGEPVR